MQIHQIMKNAMTQHKKKIELTQWAIMSGISSLVYSEYIRRIKQKTVPVKSILVPEIKSVVKILEINMELLSDFMIKSIANHNLIKKYSSSPELVLFNEENIDVLKTIFDLYITPNVIKRIPETIAMKFGLNDPKQQLVRQDRDIVLFDGKCISSNNMDFIIEQTVLQLLLLMPTIKKNVEVPEDNCRILMTKDEILTIGHENAICPIHFSDNIMNDKIVIDLLSFVTNTNITKMDGPTGMLKDNNEIVKYIIKTSVFNQVGLITLNGMEEINN